MAGHVLVFAAGELPPNGVPPFLIEAAGVVLGCDGGWKHAAQFGLDVTVILGDLDSVGQAPAGVPRVELPDQDATDLSKVLTWCETHHAGTEVHVVGLDGGRLDHRLAAPAALIEARSGAVLHFGGGDLRRIPPGSRVAVDAEEGMVIGLHPYGEVAIAHLGGVEWPLSHAKVTTGTRGVHNTAKGSTVQIEVASGDLLLSRSAVHFG